MRLNRFVPLAFLLLAVAAYGCGSDRMVVYVDGGGTGSDAGGGTRDAGPPFDAGPDHDGGPRPDAGPPRDGGGGGGSDGGSTTSGMCSNACLAMPGAVCCMMCGCSAEVRCTPECASGLVWDCELGCCFDRMSLSCAGT